MACIGFILSVFQIDVCCGIGVEVFDVEQIFYLLFEWFFFHVMAVLVVFAFLDWYPGLLCLQGIFCFCLKKGQNKRGGCSAPFGFVPAY
jgi:hypothetical protein